MTEQAPERTAVADPARIVEGFLTAIQDEDYDAMRAALDDDLVYQNVGLPTIRGGRRTVTMLRRALSRPNAGFEVKIHRSATRGNSVLNERTDVIIFGPLRVQFWVCGVFEVHDGRITLWRDYFDFLDMFKATLRAVAATVFPSLRPAL
jgi:limonene-1,2-epoxide hydrolase